MHLLMSVGFHSDISVDKMVVFQVVHFELQKRHVVGLFAPFWLFLKVHTDFPTVSAYCPVVGMLVFLRLFYIFVSTYKLT